MKVAVVGASGLVGQEVVRLLDCSGVWVAALGRRSVGLKILENKYLVQDVESFDWSQVDGVMLSAGSEVSRWLRSRHIKAWMIDNSSAFRQDANVPLIVPEIYQGKVSQVIASPNCVAIPIALVLHALAPIGRVKSIWGSTYQSISGAGRKALNDLNQAQGIFDNVYPCIGDMGEEGLTGEETKIRDEIRRILDLQVPIEIMAVRVPVSYGHGVHLRIEYENNISFAKTIEKLKEQPYIEYYKDAIPEPKRIRKCAKVHVGRLRQSESNVLGMWLVSDNVYRGAAWNMFKIASQFGFLKNGR